MPQTTRMRTLCYLFLALQVLLAGAQSDDWKGNLGGGVGISIPTGEFEQTLGKNMFLIDAHLAFPLGRIPVVQGGFAFGYSRMGQNERTVPITTDYAGVTEGTLTTNSKVFSYHPLLRLSPLQGRIRPYVDAMAGFRQFSTTSKVTAEGVEENISKERNETDVAFSTGWAAGLMFALGDHAYVEARVERFDSGEATYVDPESVTVSDQGAVGFSTFTSNTDVTNVVLGIGVCF